MSKKLTPFEALDQLRQNYKDDSHLFDNDLLDIIEPALKKGEYFEMLSKVYIYFIHDPRRKFTVLELGQIIKALEIIKATRVDTNIIKESKDYDDYCGLEAQKMLALMFSAPKQIGITKEQYEIVKEVLL